MCWTTKTCLFHHVLAIVWNPNVVFKQCDSWERILKTIKQRTNNFTKNIIVFLLNNFIQTKGRNKILLSSYILVKIKLFITKSKIFLMRVLFRCLFFLKSVPWRITIYLFYDFVPLTKYLSYFCSSSISFWCLRKI